MKKWLLLLILSLVLSIAMFSCRDIIVGYITPSPTPTMTSTSTPTVTFTVTPSPTLTFTPAPTPTNTPRPTATPVGGSQTAYIGIKICPYDFWKPCSYEGTLQFDFLTSSIKLLWDGDFNLEAFSPDGQSLLLSSGSNLYIADIDANDPIKISSNFSKNQEISAIWPRSDLIVFIGTRYDERRIHMIKPDGTDLQLITPYGKNVYQLIPINNDQGVLWEEGSLEPRGKFTGGHYWIDFDSLQSHRIPNSSQFSPSPAGNQIAYESRPSVQDSSGVWTPESHLMIMSLDTMESHEIPLPDLGILSRITNLIWLNDGYHLMLGRNQCRSVGVGEWICDIHRAGIIDLQGNEIRELPEYFGAISDPWYSSLDGKLLYRIGSREDGDNWRNWFGCFNLSTLSDIHCPNIPYTKAPLSGPVLWGPISTTIK